MDPETKIPMDPVTTIPMESAYAEKRYDNTWDSCCFKMDKRATMFFSQLAISALTMGFCIYQLVHLDNCEAQSLYSSILTLVLGVYLPSPKLNKD